METSISSHTLELLKRPSRAIIHFNDVYIEREVDFDAKLTTVFRNLGCLGDHFIPIGANLKLSEYGAVLVSELIDEQLRILSTIEQYQPVPHLRRLRNEAVLCIINNAPRSKADTAAGKNGKDFYLAITTSGLEIYSVPVTRLRALETRNKILALYRIPNEHHKIFDGKREQFRSSIITTTRYIPDILETVYEYASSEAVLKAKQAGSHPQLIPHQEFLAELAYVDKFGNVRLSIKNTQEFLARFGGKQIGDTIHLAVGDSTSIEVLYANSMSMVPSGGIGLYQNVADHIDETNPASYWELIVKVDDPNKKTRMGVDVLKELSFNYQNEEIKVWG